MRLSNVDIRHLRVFLAVVECGGFSAAEEVLGIGQSTISTHIADLERRLGYRLCERGRSGFVLNDRGRELHESTRRLIDSFAEFEERARSLREGFSGRLRLALLDNLITDPACPVIPALRALASFGHGPRINIEVLPPAELELAVASGRFDAGVSIAERRLPSLVYRHLYRERDLLVCGRGQALYGETDPAAIRGAIITAPKVVRSFLHHHDFFLISDREESITATVTNLESAAFLILAGTHIGFLPEHFVERWLRSGEMRALLPDEVTRESEIALVTPAAADGEISPAVQRFIEALVAHADADASKIPMHRSKEQRGSALAVDRY